MKKALQKASKVIKSNEEHIRKNIHNRDSMVSFYGNSIQKKGNAIISLSRDHISRFLMVISIREDGVIAKFAGEQIGDEGVFARKCPLNAANAEVLRELFPWTAPISSRGIGVTIGCGDRIGVASPGHIASVTQFNAFPVLAQQSIREIKGTGRTFQDVVDDVTFSVFQLGYKNGYGADGDHLKTITNINRALDAGMTMITIDLSDEIDTQAYNLSDKAIETEYNNLPSTVRKHVEATYVDKTFNSVTFDKKTAMRCAVLYTKAINFATRANKHLVENRGSDFDYEISIDEMPVPTSAEDHIYIANELLNRDIAFTSLAPKFVDGFSRGIDYSGDKKLFADVLKMHVDIADYFESYKLSIHTGSDKFSIYDKIGKLTGMKFHLKTSGTSWLEALKVLADKDPTLFRAIHTRCVDNFSAIKDAYGLKIDLKDIPDIKSLYDEDLPGLFDDDNVRQLLHSSYANVLKDHSLKPMLYSAIHENEVFYHKRLKKYFDKHMRALGLKKDYVININL